MGIAEPSPWRCDGPRNSGDTFAVARTLSFEAPRSNPDPGSLCMKLTTDPKLGIRLQHESDSKPLSTGTRPWQDDDLDGLEIAGDLIWQPPANLDQVTHYEPYLQSIGLRLPKTQSAGASTRGCSADPKSRQMEKLWNMLSGLKFVVLSFDFSGDHADHACSRLQKTSQRHEGCLFATAEGRLLGQQLLRCLALSNRHPRHPRGHEPADPVGGSEPSKGSLSCCSSCSIFVFWPQIGTRHVWYWAQGQRNERVEASTKHVSRLH